MTDGSITTLLVNCVDSTDSGAVMPELTEGECTCDLVCIGFGSERECSGSCDNFCEGAKINGGLMGDGICECSFKCDTLRLKLNKQLYIVT